MTKKERFNVSCKEAPEKGSFFCHCERDQLNNRKTVAVIVSHFVFLDKKTLLNVERHDMDIFVIFGQPDENNKIIPFLCRLFVNFFFGVSYTGTEGCYLIFLVIIHKMQSFSKRFEACASQPLRKMIAEECGKCCSDISCNMFFFLSAKREIWLNI